MAKGETDERLTSPEIDRRRCWNDVGGIWRSIESKRLPVARSLSRRVADVSPSSLSPRYPASCRGDFYRVGRNSLAA